MTNKHFQICLLTILTTQPLISHTCSRSRSYGEPCGNYQQNQLAYSQQYPYNVQGNQGYDQQTNKVVSSQDDCDSRRFLRCDRNTGTCRCPDPWKYYWDTYESRCFIKIGYECTETFGGWAEAYYGHGCPGNSYCNPGKGKCDCKPLFKVNYDYTGCSLSAAFNVCQMSLTSMLLSIVVGLFIQL